ncbi:choline ABC transporter ATP-binding protein [Methylobacterium nodulans]|uniref:Choline ABC transporter, ATP-binding protein n=1 Tax=Methylobacterium nodulans (strain LMG 21967 / CNCM I-2342 / ORS 2060) TaxID=460265 RepID=B8IVT5_METNO|nr:choline ABC transporter ATP-binding protein [Methylobacterium nodulans]ACL62525.1 choline ABC transporter, ATP-binding protein [Methylobacterium nodulans ORS 2060]
MKALSPVSRTSPENAIELRDVAIVFGRDVKAALALADQGATRELIRERVNALMGTFKVNLDVKPGEICVLMGLSGSGKSTVLRAINGLNPVARGSVLVRHRGEAVDMTRCRASTLREVRLNTVSMVFQQFGLLPWRSVRDNVGFGLELRGVPAAERQRIVDEKLEMVGLASWADKMVQELSGGMQQRVGLARAFATDADILLMDEPFSALDPLIRDKLQDDLLELQRKLHKTIVFVSHDLSEALKLGNRIAIMEGGHVVQFGTPSDIVLRPANSYVTEFVKHMNPLEVLDSGAVMTPVSALRREGDAVLLDGSGEVRISLDCAERPVMAHIGGRAEALERADATGACGDPGRVVVAPVMLPLRAAIDLRLRSPYPIVFVDQLGRLAGLCDHSEIYRGLLQNT